MDHSALSTTTIPGLRLHERQAQASASSYDKNMEIYEEALELLHA